MNLARQFGPALVSRPAGREAFAALDANALRGLDAGEPIEIDFEYLDVLTSSWAEEFFDALQVHYGDRVRILPSDNPSVKLVLEGMEQRSAT